MSLTIEAIAGRARKSCQTGKKLTARFLRDNLDHAPSGDEFALMHREVERQNAISLARRKQAGTSGQITTDPLAMRAWLKRSLGHGRFEGIAKFNAANRVVAAAEKKIKEGDRSRETFVAAGLPHLAGRRIEKSKRGSWGWVSGNRVTALTERECELLGKTPGPANYL